MTSPETPPAAPVVPLYPPLGSPTFNSLAYTYGSSMPAVVDGIDALAESAFANATSAFESATAATTASADAQAAATAAANASSASKWVSGTTYAEGAAVWSPINYQGYRRKVAGAGVLDPSVDDVNWAALGAAVGTLPNFLLFSQGVI